MSDSERHFNVDRVRADLPRESARSGAVAVGGRAVLVTLQVLSTMVLARLLTPMDFGVMAMVMPVAMLVNKVAYSGLRSTVMHQEVLDADRASEYFRSAVWWNLVLALAMALSGPALAWLYDDSRVIRLALAWSVVVYVGSLGAMPEGLLKRQMRFVAAVAIQLSAVTAGIVVAIVAALAGAGYWALLLQLAAWRTTEALLSWRVSGWRPRIRSTAPRSSGRTSFHEYWAGVSGFRLVDWAAEQADRVVIGVLGGAGVLGLYQTGRRWAWYPFTELFGALSDVAISGLSRVQRDEQYRGYVKRALLPLFSLAMPVASFVFVEVGRFVDVLLGDQWTGAVVYVQLMAVAAFVGGLIRVTQWIYLSRGETGRQFKWVWVTASVQLAAVAIGASWGPLGVAMGVTAGVCLMAVPSVSFAVRPTPLRTWDILGVVVRPAIAAILAGAFVFIVSPTIPATPSVVLDLSLRAALHGSVYIAVWVGLPGGRAAKAEIAQALGTLRPRTGA